MAEIYKPKNEGERMLMKAIASIKSEDEASALLRDMLTPAEIAEFANRLTIAQLLTKGLPYLEIAKQVGTSTTTVTRVAHWLNNGCGGYRLALKRILKA